MASRNFLVATRLVVMFAVEAFVFLVSLVLNPDGDLAVTGAGPSGFLDPEHICFCFVQTE